MDDATGKNILWKDRKVNMIHAMLETRTCHDNP